MATKHFCDLCKEEIKDDKFRCELVLVKVKETFVFLQHQKTSQPQIIEKRYQFCQKCLSDKLPGFDS